MCSLTTCFFLAFATPAMASEAGLGAISDLQIDGNRVLFALSGPRTGRPACAIWDRFVFDLTATNGAAMLAYLLSAEATGKQIRVYGTNDCALVANSETAYSLRGG